MTIKLQYEPDTLADRILRCFGKERAYVIPVAAGQNYGSYAYAITVRESFCQALFRQRNRPLPDGLISKKQMEELLDGQQELRPDDK